jgi:predicted ATP-dependent serine protease
MGLVTKGDFNEYVSESPIQLGIFGSPTQTYTVSDIDVSGAKEITIQLNNGMVGEDGSLTGGSDHVTISVYGDTGIGYTTVALKTLNVEANTSNILVVPTGISKIKVVFANTDAINTATILYNILVKR